MDSLHRLCNRNKRRDSVMQVRSSSYDGSSDCALVLMILRDSGLLRSRLRLDILVHPLLVSAARDERFTSVIPLRATYGCCRIGPR